MADNFVRKTVQSTTKLPNLSFYEFGDIVLLNKNSIYMAMEVNHKKQWVSVLNSFSLGTVNNKIATLEKTVADHETRIKALETAITALVNKEVK